MPLPDFDAEGLLVGLDPFARGARLELLEQLYADGVSLETLRRAVAEERLVLLPVERVLAGDRPYSLNEVAELAGLSPTCSSASGSPVGAPRVIVTI
jgi:hypothetical protein